LYFGDGKTNTRCVIPKALRLFSCGKTPQRFWNGIVFDTASPGTRRSRCADDSSAGPALH
jgi:hypothetical protein